MSRRHFQMNMTLSLESRRAGRQSKPLFQRTKALRQKSMTTSVCGPEVDSRPSSLPTRTGEGPSEAAREEGRKPAQGHKIVETTRNHHIKVLKAARLAALIPGVAVALLWICGTSVTPWVMSGERTVAHTEETNAPRPLAETRAPATRARAAEECANQQWTECEHDLDLAYEMDQAGNLAPDVQAMRWQIIGTQNRAR
jgi:hypothetical protein